MPLTDVTKKTGFSPNLKNSHFKFWAKARDDWLGIFLPPHKCGGY
jgi:hypothetical protein